MGSKKLFNIIGTGFFGNVFEILMVLPEIMDLLISGLIEEKEDVQSRVTVAVGMNVGSTVFASHCSGECVEGFTTDKSSSQDSEPPSTSKLLLITEKLSFLTDTGIKTGEKTSYTAGIMLLSLIPFIILQLSNIAKTSSASCMLILMALIVLVSGLLSYFMYQNLLAGFSQYMQSHAQGKLVTNEGLPNIPIMKGWLSTFQIKKQK
ncbi:hypothetical protein HYC85_017951 [Camellia sinensis]|uniref:Sodium/calcium exchanger membrane region domain-containing protein n=1 Tax=Camellia sinensis TaxID=4442 RepID=A0A7J7GWK9_CAMSI|nr:hypothetical protein HYC85_017951 [Camellia sinensis]